MRPSTPAPVQPQAEISNAACNFRPYPNLTPKRQALPDSPIDRILAEIGKIPDRPPFEITLARVNQPFLDNRILDISMEIERRLPEAVTFVFSNGTPLNEKNLPRLAELERVRFRPHARVRGGRDASLAPC